MITVINNDLFTRDYKRGRDALTKQYFLDTTYKAF